MKKFHLEIVTPDGLCFSGEVESLLVHTTEGDVEFLAGHTDYFASVTLGRARLLIDGEVRFASVNGGFVSVKDGKVQLVCTTLEFKDEINLDRALLAKEKAEASLNDAKDKLAEERAEAKLARALNRIRVANMK